MKLITLILSDSAYSRALEFAGMHGVSVEAYVATEVEDLLDKRAPLPPSQPSTNSKPATNEFAPSPSFRRAMPDTLEQVLAVCKHVYRSRTVPQDPQSARDEFLDALNIVAKNTVNSQTGFKGVEVTTVRDKCTTDRRLGLPGVHIDASTFVGWLCSPELLRDHLCRKFPPFVSEIHKCFSDLLPGKFQAS